MFQKLYHIARDEAVNGKNRGCQPRLRESIAMFKEVGYISLDRSGKGRGWSRS
jgi:hypothetical protein